jgi:uncharacterized protein (TIGR00369 family)
MKKIRNPFPGLAGKDYQCFGCSPFNEHGLQLEFWDNDGEVVCKWLPTPKFEGWRGVVHGGILATLIDEVANWLVLTRHKTAGVTTEMKVKYVKPVRIVNGEIQVTARFLRQDQKTVTVSCDITDKEGNPCVTAEVTYFVFPEEIATKKYHYPGADAFQS